MNPTQSRPSKEPLWAPGWIEAWRVWNYIEKDGELTLVSFAGPDHQVEWPKRKRFEAKCPAGKSSPCDKVCGGYGHGCGVYAVKTREQLSTFGRRANMPWVAGRIKLWGSVWEHRVGWRAQFAYPLELVSVRSTRSTWRSKPLERLSVAYGLRW